MTIEGKISILTDKRGTTIQIMDEASRIRFVEVYLTPEQFCAALGRLADVPCESIKVKGLSKIGRKLETKHIEFIMPDSKAYDKKLAESIASTLLCEGWEIYDSFSSQGSFFIKDGQHYARCCIRRWV